MQKASRVHHRPDDQPVIDPAWMVADGIFHANIRQISRCCREPCRSEFGWRKYKVSKSIGQMQPRCPFDQLSGFQVAYIRVGPILAWSISQPFRSDRLQQIIGGPRRAPRFNIRMVARKRAVVR